MPFRSRARGPPACCTGCAGLQKGSKQNENVGTLTITGSGTLDAQGGKGNAVGAGIGGGGAITNFVGTNITISGGSVTATGGNGGAGSGSGSLSTGTNGNAWINASSISSGNNCSGVIFNGNAGQIYGSSYTLNQNAEIPSGKTLTMLSGKALTIDTGAALTNNESQSVFYTGIPATNSVRITGSAAKGSANEKSKRSCWKTAKVHKPRRAACCGASRRFCKKKTTG